MRYPNNCCVLGQGSTALIGACAAGCTEVVKLLLAAPGIDYNHQNDQVTNLALCMLRTMQSAHFICLRCCLLTLHYYARFVIVGCDCTYDCKW
jgi:ankyrin repeat protein